MRYVISYITSIEKPAHSYCMKSLDLFVMANASESISFGKANIRNPNKAQQQLN